MTTANESSIYFYSHRDPVYGFLSNFFLSDFVVDGVTYSCMEKYIMKQKQETFDPENVELSDMIMHCNHPQTIKKYGRSVANYNDAVWAEKRIQVAYDGFICEIFSTGRIESQIIRNWREEVV